MKPMPTNRLDHRVAATRLRSAKRTGGKPLVPISSGLTVRKP